MFTRLDWRDKQTVRDLIACHERSVQRRQDREESAKNRKLSALIHEDFVKLHPSCHLSPAILTAKFYTFKDEFISGALDLSGTVEPAFNDDNAVNNTEENVVAMSMLDQVAVSPVKSLGKDIIYRKWSKEMIDNLCRTRKVALIRKQQLIERGQVDVQLIDVWYEEFMKIHPEYKSTKKNLMQKYKWYRSRLKKLEGAGKVEKLNQMMKLDDEESVNVPPAKKPPAAVDPVIEAIKAKNIRKDLFLHIKSMMEEQKIFLPMKLPQEPELKRPVSPPMAHPSSMIASETLAAMHQQVLMQQQPQGYFDGPVNLSKETSIFPQQQKLEQAEEAEQDKKEAIKLPGGATLVAVTDRNADALLKPKALEKPQVTITPHVTISMKEESMPLSSEVNILPINIPKYLPGTPPPLHQLNRKPQQQQQPHFNPNYQQLPQGRKAIYIPSRVKARLDEFGITDLQFFELLQLYEKARNEYIDTLRSGYLAFFPYILGNYWQNLHQEPPMGGRKLAALIDLYVEEKNKGKVVTPEYLTKKPCMFEVTEKLLKDVLLTRAEIMKEMETRGDVMNSAMANVELCKRWSLNFSQFRMTTKQLISIHEMLTFDPRFCDPSPVVACNAAESWKILENSLPQRKSSAEELRLETAADAAENDPEDDPESDDENMSMEKKQECLLAVREIINRKNRVKIARPRIAAKNIKLFWTEERLAALETCRKKAIRKIMIRKNRTPGARPTLNDLIFAYWRAKNPDTRLTKRQVVSKCISGIRCGKRRKARDENRVFRRWQKECKKFAENEDRIQVIPEGLPIVPEAEPEPEEDYFDFEEKVSDKDRRNFHDDREVLSFIGELQRSGGKRGGSKYTQPINWSPEVIADLLKARKIARKRKRDWEDWATREYGGIGAAYTNPDIKFLKIDDLFKEEWAKLRPDMAALSIWTLVAYARKYDNFKKMLITDHEQDELRLLQNQEKNRRQSEEEKSAISKVALFYPNSCIPKFNLDKLADIRLHCESEDDREFVDLVITRQKAKLRQLESVQAAKMLLQYIWQEEWINLHPHRADLSGFHLQSKLFAYENDPAKVTLLRAAMETKLAEGRLANLVPDGQHDEKPASLPRSQIFPSDQIEPRPVRFGQVLRTQYKESGRVKKRRRQITLHPDYFAESTVKKMKLSSIPAVEKVEDEPWYGDDFSDADEDDLFDCDDDDDDDPCGRKYRSKLFNDNRRRSMANFLPELRHQKGNNSVYHCGECDKDFHNVNNFGYHKLLHEK